MVGGGFPLEIRDVVCRMDCAGLSVHSFCCALLIQSRAQGVILCAIQAFTPVSQILLFCEFSRLIWCLFSHRIVPHCSQICRGFKVFSRFFAQII